MKYKMLLVLMLVAIFGTTLLPFQVIALPDASSSNDSKNYRGFVTISARNTNFLWDIPRSNIRFALWTGKTWIDLPFWIVKSQEYQTHVDMNNTNTNMDRVVYSNRISSEDYFVVVVPNKKGIEASYKNWWPKARKANAFARSKIVIEKQFTNNTSSSSHTILDLLFKNKNNDNSIVIYVYYSKNAMFIPTKWDMTKAYFFFDRPASTSSEKNSNSTNMNQELYHKITVIEFTKRFKNIYKVISISDPVKLQTNSLFRTKSNTVTVLKNQILMKFYQFKNTGWHPQKAERFLLPPRTTSISDIELHIEGVAPKGAYNRYLNITLYHFKSDDTEEAYNLEYTVLTEDEFSYNFTINDKVLYFGDSGYSDWSNYLEITITTWTGGQAYPDEYWVVNASLRYYYSASDTHLTSLKVDLAQPRFDFKHTGWKIVKFPLPLPDNKIFDQDSATVTFNLHFDAVSDPYTRVLKVYLITDVGTQLIYSGTVNPGLGDKHFTLSADQVQDYLNPVTEAQVGIVLTTYVGYWKMTGQVIVKYRPEIFPDNIPRWSETHIPYYHRVGSIFAVDYDEHTYHNRLLGIFSYVVLYRKSSEHFQFEFSTLMISDYYTRHEFLTIETCIKDGHEVAGGVFTSYHERKYIDGAATRESQREMAKTAAVLLTAIALGISIIVAAETSPPLALKLVPIALKFGSLALANLAGTSQDLGEITTKDNPVTSSFSEAPYPTHDDTIDKYVSQDNYLISFTDNHDLESSSQFTYEFNIELTMVETHYYVYIPTEISLHDSFQFAPSNT